MICMVMTALQFLSWYGYFWICTVFKWMLDVCVSKYKCKDNELHMNEIMHFLTQINLHFFSIFEIISCLVKFKIYHCQLMVRLRLSCSWSDQASLLVRRTLIWHVSQSGEEASLAPSSCDWSVTSKTHLTSSYKQTSRWRAPCTPSLR